MQSVKYKLMISLLNVLGVRKNLEKTGKDLEKVLETAKEDNKKRVPEKTIKQYANETIILDQRPVYIFKPKNKAKGAVIYLSGGGFMMSATKGDFKWARELSDQANVDVYLPQYPLVPDYTINDTVMFIDKLYKEILKKWENKQIQFLGFSSGASLTLYYLTYLCKNNIKDIFPKKVYLSSPALEVPPSDETYKRMVSRGEKDPMVPADLFINLVPYLLKDDSYSYLMMPETVSLEGICPVYVSYGEIETMRGYLEIIERIAKRDGFELEVKIGEVMIHCWQNFTITKEGRSGQKELIDKISATNI